MGHFNNIIIRPQTGEVATSQVGTIYQDLPEMGMLSQLMVDVAAASNYSTHPGLDIWNAITRIEVLVNGSKVIKSFDMKQARALAHFHGYDLSTLGCYGRGRTTGDFTYWNIPIMFGRYAGDKEYMLDMEQYSNPQLRITYDLSQTTVEGVTYAVTATPTLRTGVQGLIWKGANPGTKGYIKSTNIDTWSNVVSTVRTVEIPRGQKLLGVMQGARHLNQKLIDYIERMEITFDNGDWQPINHSYQQLKSLESMWFSREVNTVVKKDLATTDEIDTMVGEITNITFMSLSGAVTADKEAMSHDEVQNIDQFVATAAMRAYLVKCQGVFPHQNIYIPMSEYSEDDAFGVDTTKWGRIDLKTTSGAGGTAGELLRTVAEYNVPNGE
jgi:hypothetical protein